MHELASRNEVWRTSSHTADSGNCIEVGRNHRESIIVRDSKDRDGLRLAFNSVEWKEFIRRVANGEF
jgi:Domain of unknown function (DUF397)